jgi:ADP-heptose:LPS heptosyltransferase
MIAHFDCRYFSGYKPCMFRRECDGCPHYSPFGTRILVIKLAAMGDVLRCTTLLRGLTRTYPGCHITWLTEANIVALLRGIPEIDRLLTYDFESVLQLENEKFDYVYCFDKEPRATGLAMKVRAERKIGFGMSEFGNVMPLNPESEYSFELGINDPLKFKINTKTYPELLYECAGIPYLEPQEYLFPDLSAEIAEGRDYLKGLGVFPEDLKVGLNTGAGDVFATKKWTEEGYAQLAKQLVETFGARVLLLGGPGESERNLRIAAAANCPVVDTGGHHAIRKFAGIVGNCDLMVTGDTLAMHVGIGMKIPVLVILGSTCHQEIELYGRGAKVVSDFECSPCFLKVCPKEITCMEAMPSELVFDEAAKLLALVPKAVRKNSQAALS